MILMGVPGSGRRTLCRLASYMASCKLFEANLKDGHVGIAWAEMLKQMLYTAGVQGR